MRQLAPNLTLSAAASIVPWNDANGSPLTDVSAYNNVLDWVGKSLSPPSFPCTHVHTRDHEL